MVQYSENDVFTFTWIIENFSMCPFKKGEKLKSPAFVVDALGKTKWRLWLYPKGNDGPDDEYLAYYLSRVSKKEEPEEIAANFNISLIEARQSSKTHLNNNRVFNKKVSWASREFALRNDLFDNKKVFLPNDVLTLRCCIFPNPDDIEFHAEPKARKNVFGTNFSLGGISSIVSDDSRSTQHCRNRCSYHTRIPVQRREITWTIKNFNSTLKTKKFIPVSVESSLSQKTALLLSCYVIGDSNSDGTVRIDIQRKDRDLNQMLVRCKVSVLDMNSDAKASQEAEHLFGENYKAWSFPPIIKLSTLEKHKSVLLVDDKLFLLCEFIISTKENMFSSCIVSDLQTNSLGTNDLRMGLINLLKDREFTDVILFSQDLQFPAHKSVLCARSPVFQAMFRGDTQETRTGVVRISDIDAETVRKMRDFMYEDHLPALRPEDAIKLYSAADKYNILTLKSQCSTFLNYNLSLSNVCDVLVLADLYQDSNLMRSVIHFLRIHEKDVFQSNPWKELMKANFQLCGEIMQKVLSLMWN